MEVHDRVTTERFSDCSFFGHDGDGAEDLGRASVDNSPKSEEGNAGTHGCGGLEYIRQLAILRRNRTEAQGNRATRSGAHQAQNVNVDVHT